MKYLYTLLFLLSCCAAQAQNLVPNPSFEVIDSCPNLLGQVERAKQWYKAKNTPDYFNACSNSVAPPIGVPLNYWTYREASSGIAYCGIWTYAAYPSPGYNEAIGTKLIDTMIIGKKYLVSMKLSSVSSHKQSANGANDKIGILFSTKKYDLMRLPPTNNWCQIYTQNIITDTINWTLFSQTFIPDSAYSHITIGVFFDNEHIDTSRYWFIKGNRELVSYYFVDDICITTDSIGCNFSNNINSVERESLLLYPNPANDLLEVKGLGTNLNSILLFNSLGQLVYEDKNPLKNSSYQINTSKYAEGVYFLQFNFNHKNITRKTFIIH